MKLFADKVSAHKWMKSISVMLFIVLIIFGLQQTVLAMGVKPSGSAQQYPETVYWGDTHLHTNLSFDGYGTGTTQLGPEQAYRFAKGEEVTGYYGDTMQLSRPLDFLVVADHATNLGVVKALFEEDLPRPNNTVVRDWLDRAADIVALDSDNQKVIATYKLMGELITAGEQGLQPIIRSAWQQVIASADKHNDADHFTAFIGYEWTAMFNLHRVVIFKDGADKVSQVNPFPAYPAASHSDPEKLWGYMQDYETNTGGEVLAIPHNSNLSFGVMFAPQTAKGETFTTKYAATRSRWEPLVEVTQIKGDSETHPLLSVDDSFSDYERLQTSTDRPPWGLTEFRKSGYRDYQHWYEKNRSTASSDEWMLRYSYVRSALKLGLQHQRALGVNPFKFGMIGSTDAHSAFAAVDENNFGGKYGPDSPNKNRIHAPWDSRLEIDQAGDGFEAKGWTQNAAGYAAVWAEENTRESLFAAMKRKEVYATTGPRITVRFFGGWDYRPNDAFQSDMAGIGYSRGVPMGGDLSMAPKGKSPTFLIRAIKDPEGANLDRVQVIKGWHDANGELHEKIYNVALSDGRKENWRSKVKPVGDTVNIPDASYINTIGDPELAVVWKDPDFDKDELAFYYLRVLEIPTPRWTAYDAKYFKLKDIPEEVSMITQERAYTSPIWYTPTSYQ